MEFTIRSRKREDVVDITEQIKKLVVGKKAEEGKAVLVYTPHTTCAIMINENYDPNVCIDILAALKNMIPAGKWLHDKIDDNADAHIKASIIGPSVVIPFENGKMKLGTWQNIILGEFDGPKERTIIVEIL